MSTPIANDDACSSSIPDESSGKNIDISKSNPRDYYPGGAYVKNQAPSYKALPHSSSLSSQGESAYYGEVSNNQNNQRSPKGEFYQGHIKRLRNPRTYDGGTGPTDELSDPKYHYDCTTPRHAHKCWDIQDSVAARHNDGQSVPDDKGFIVPDDFNYLAVPHEEEQGFLSDPSPHAVARNQALVSHTCRAPLSNDINSHNCCDTVTACSDVLGEHPVEDNSIIHGSADPFVRQAVIFSTIWPHTTYAAKQVAPQFCQGYEAILATAQPNYRVAKIQVQSALNLDAWDSALEGYHDREICSYLRYGWPLGYHKATPPISVDKNHPSAVQHQAHVDSFIKKELELGALLGPFDELPFAPWFRCSPVMTRPKKDSLERRIIVDLTFPEGQGVNDGIDIYDYYGNNISYTLPSLGDLIARLQNLEPGALLWKADLARAYRQLRIDPVEAPLLGIKVEGRYYIDLCPPFGCKTSSAACQRLSNAMIYLMRQEGFFVLAYLDDYGGCQGDYATAQASYSRFLQLANQLGLQLAAHKCVPPLYRD